MHATVPSAKDARKAIATWLFVCCALLFAMVVLGGVTRLTHSGLSIVEWQPVVGTLPPLTQEDWQTTFEKYRQTPEYKRVNAAMTLEQFKGIFWLEYFHRLLGRVIGVAFFVPLLYFAVKRYLDPPLLWKLSAIFVLGALQGALGWYMVASGLISEPRVSQYRLTAHLALAFAIYATMLWIGRDLVAGSDGRSSDPQATSLRVHGWAVVGLAAVVVLSGGFVAGLHAGLAYNTFPLMNGYWLPPGIAMLEPWYENVFNNITTVQFDHRVLAFLLTLLVVSFWARTRSPFSSRTRKQANGLLAALILQVTLGIATLLLVVPVPLAAAHQAGALLLFTMAIIVAHGLHRHANRYERLRFAEQRAE